MFVPIPSVPPADLSLHPLSRERTRGWKIIGSAMSQEKRQLPFHDVHISLSVSALFLSITITGEDLTALP